MVTRFRYNEFRAQDKRAKMTEDEKMMVFTDLRDMMEIQEKILDMDRAQVVDMIINHGKSTPTMEVLTVTCDGTDDFVSFRLVKATREVFVSFSRFDANFNVDEMEYRFAPPGYGMDRAQPFLHLINGQPVVVTV